VSCHRDRAFQQAQRDTWLKDLCVTDHKFFLGRPSDQPEADEVFLDVNDSYQGLSLKTQAICRWALDNDFDYVFKCDTDTVVNPWEFVFNDFQNYHYSGGFNEDVVPAFSSEKILFASGGAGYWLSKNALTIVANAASIVTAAEDVFVAAALRAEKIFPMWNSGYRWRPGETIDKFVISLHLSSALQKKYEPALMYEYYQKIKDTL
jgi:hypothetical protein